MSQPAPPMPWYTWEMEAEHDRDHVLLVKHGHVEALDQGFPAFRAEPPGKADMVAFTNRAQIPKHVLVRVLDRESVLLNLETEKYFGLDETGTRMWQLATSSPNIDAAYQELLEEFDVAPELLQNNLRDLLDKLVEHGLVEMLPVDASATPAV